MIVPILRISLFLLIVIIVSGCGLTREAPSTDIAKTTPPIVPEVQDKPPPPPPKQHIETVLADFLNLRKEASSKSLILAVLKKGEMVEVFSVKGKWIEVTNNKGKKGWVYGRYISGGKDLNKKIQKTKTEIIVTSEPQPPSEEKPAKQIQVEMASEDTSPPEPLVEEDIPSDTPVEPYQTTVLYKKFFIKLYNDIRGAVEKQDLALFNNLFLSSDLSNKKMDSGQLTEMKEKMSVLLPDLSTAEIIKFYHNQTAAKFIVKTDLDDKKNINLAAIRFIHSNNGWKMQGKVSRHSFLRKNAHEDEKALTAELKKNPIFQFKNPFKMAPKKD